MPDLGIGEILAIASIVAGATTTGVSIYESGQQQDATNKAQKAAQQAAAQQQLLQKREALVAASPNAQAQTGGSLTGPAGQSFIDVLAGLPGTTGGASSSPAATSAASNTTSSPYGAPSADALTAFMNNQQGQPSGGGFSGGWQPAQSPQPNRFQLTDFLT